jgi:glucose/arabinose dehydrogenase
MSLSRVLAAACVTAAIPIASDALAQQQPPPAWAQGRPAGMESSTLAPHAPRMTVTTPDKIPLDKLKVPSGFRVELWAHGMPGARMMTAGDKGTVFVGTRTIGRVYAVTDGGGERKTQVLAQGLTQPNGVVFRNGALYVAAISRVLRYDGIEDKLASPPQPVDLTQAFALPTDQHHGWKFLAFGPDNKLYVPIGAPCNICEPPAANAQIRRYNADGSGMEVVARGVRNSVGFDFHPRTGQLWFTDNGRDWAGEDGPEEELNRVASVGEDFGFPYCHAQGLADPDIKKPDACDGVTKPVATLGPHAAALGMRFYTGSMFPAEYRDRIFIARRGSWNRTEKFGYDVAVVTANPDGTNAKVEPFMTGFLDKQANGFWGRPVDVMQMRDGSLLVSDEENGAIYRVSYQN